jgi:mono/diheme cytochrome c family protein
MKSVLLKFVASGVVSIGVSAVPANAQSDEAMFGKALFVENCAACHGADAMGSGPVAVLFAEQPRDLRVLSKKNNGIFPFSDVYQSINGRREIAGHGTTDMPVWGDLFMIEAGPNTFHPGVDAEEIVQGRILSLVYYLQTIQE